MLIAKRISEPLKMIWALNSGEVWQTFLKGTLLWYTYSRSDFCEWHSPIRLKCPCVSEISLSLLTYSSKYGAERWIFMILQAQIRWFRAVLGPCFKHVIIVTIFRWSLCCSVESISLHKIKVHFRFPVRASNLRSNEVMQMIPPLMHACDTRDVKQETS